MFDYIIVGGGSAGCVLAARLSEDPASQVLLLEAGPAGDAPEIAMPGATFTLWHGPFAWDDQTVPQAAAAGRQIALPHGRALGGGSAINGMVYIRGNRADYDGWRDEHGCAGWSYADLLPYFCLAEDQQRGASAFHGAGGPQRVEDLRYTHPLSAAWVESAVAAGLPRNDDFNGADQRGVGYYQLNQRGGRRWSAADGYLRPAAGRANLTVETGARATGLIITGGRAAGVRYRQEGGQREALASREVIVCAGAIGSPQLLLLSGIGPAGQLREHGIDVIADVPGVGAGLQDHPICIPEWRAPGAPNLWEEATPGNLALWQRERRGPMASSGAEAGGFSTSSGQLPAPDLQFGLLPGPAPGAGPPDHRAVAQLIIAVHVRSRGSVTLRSADPDARPVIDPNYLADEADLDLLLAGLRQAREIAACQPLAGLVEGEQAPGERLADDEPLREWIRANLGTAFHPAGTCAMGAGRAAVCDPELRVNGIGGLRVADASVMPALPRGNINAPVIAIAERAADLIRGNTPLAPARPGLQAVR